MPSALTHATSQALQTARAACTERGSANGKSVHNTVTRCFLRTYCSAVCAANAAYLLRGERVLHEVEADRAHQFAAESARGDGDNRGVRHHLVRLAVQLVQAQLWGEKEGGREREGRRAG